MKTGKNVCFLTLCFVSCLAGCLSGSRVSVPPDDSLGRLKEGNARYTSGHAKHPNQSVEHRKELTKEQHPFVTILSCSDSRVPPEIIFDQGLGDIFSVRVAGNVADTDEIASIEYGAGHLHTPLLVVLGHARCGAVMAVVAGGDAPGSIPKLLAHISPAVEEAGAAGATGDQLIDAAIRANVRKSVSDIINRSEEARALVKAGKLKIVGAVYDLETGKVEWLDGFSSQTDLIDGRKTGQHTETEH